MNSPESIRIVDQKAQGDVNGRGGGIRTHDPLLPKQMRYQAALRPDKLIVTYCLLTARSSRGTAEESLTNAATGRIKGAFLKFDLDLIEFCPKHTNFIQNQKFNRDFCRFLSKPRSMDT